jgi:protein tyrosine phosphatase
VWQAVLWEFDRLHSMGEPPSSDLGAEQDNKRKNRYCDVLPFDYNCVRLGKEQHYINASFLRSKDNEAAQWAYIAAQVSLSRQT